MAAGQGYDTGTDQKMRALDLVLEGRPLAEIARDIGKNRSTVTRWKTNPRVVAEWERRRGRVWNGGRASVAEVSAPVAEVVARLDRVAPAPPDTDDPREIVMAHGAPPGFRRDAEVLARLAVRLADGMPPKWACRRVGISYRAWKRWVRLAEQGREGYAEFLDVLHQVQAIGVEAALAMIREGGNGWQGSAWTLERLWPEDFGRRQPQEDEGVGGAADESDEALRAAIAAADAAKEEAAQLARD